MKLFQLHILKTLYYNGMNVSRAAEQHYVVQSAISRQLTLLEEELGMSLFLRNGKRLVEPTPLCRALIPQIETIDQTMENIRSLTDEYRTGSEGEIRIATTHMQAKYYLPEILSQFRERYPAISIHLLQGAPSELVQMLRDNKADFAICTEELSGAKGLDYANCYDWNHALVVEKEHPLSTGELTLERIAKHPVLTYIFGFTGRKKIQKTFIDANLDLDIKLSATDTDVILSYVKLGFGAGIIAKLAYKDTTNDNLVLRDLSHLFEPSTTRVAWLKNKYLKKNLKDLIELLKNTEQK